MTSTQLILSLIQENIFSFTSLLVFFSLVTHLINSYLLRKRLPVGPTGLPLVGYLPFLGKEPHKSAAKLTEKFGNVFTLQLGIHSIVFLNDFDAVKDALSNDLLLGRPTSSPFTFLSKTTSFVDDNGEVWREHRRFSMQLMRDLGTGKGSMEDRITEEIDYLIKRIEQNNGQPIDFKSELVPSISNNISHLVFGHRFDVNEPKRKLLDKQLNQGSSLFSPTGILATCPVWMAKIFLKFGAVANNESIQNAFNIFDQEISEHKSRFNENNIRDYMDGYLAEMQTRRMKDPNTTFTDEKLHINSMAFFGAGSETVRVTTEWAVLFAAQYPNYQQMVQAEIDSVVGSQRSVAWADRLLMPFTQAFILEVYRMKPAVPFNSLRRALEDTHILNHFIPKDTSVLANFWAVHNDPKLWENPEQFNPNRFLSNDGKQIIKSQFIIPFSIGKRSCAGETLARTEVFLYIASLLHKFTISGAEGHVLSLKDEFGFSLQPKDPSILVFKNRI